LLAKVNQSLPTIVPATKVASGSDVANAALTVDGASSHALNGQAIPIQPRAGPRFSRTLNSRTGLGLLGLRRVSVDPAKVCAKLEAGLALTFPLIPDVKHVAIDAYGVYDQENELSWPAVYSPDKFQLDASPGPPICP
jgi:hypothetical protein